MKVYIVGEDAVTVAIIKKIIAYCSTEIEIITELPARGGKVKSKIDEFNALSNAFPVILLIDLDADTCAPLLLKKLVENKNDNFIFNIAVDEAEAWLMADREGFAAYFGIKLEDMPISHKTKQGGRKELTEMKFDSKSSWFLTHELIKKSGNSGFIRQLTPKDGAAKGPEYNAGILPFIENGWSIDNARNNSDSLDRMIGRIETVSKKDISNFKLREKLSIYNTLSRKKELFKPLYSPGAGLYVCGPTVYGDPHLGHARPAITFDVLFRYLTHLKYKVRYVRNITDVGHLVNDADSGEDKIAKKARLENIEPMEVVQYYLNRYHKAMDALNVLPPSIEPHASGHIIEQIRLVKDILDKGYAYESEGSVYFDVEKYNGKYHYGILSGRNIEDMLNTTRELEGQEEKRNPVDFALWKKAAPEHIMRWPSPWSEGFPGWHLECTAMGKKYLGEEFDIHGGGMDLIFPHHECEIAQSMASTGKQAVKYWMHNNMITVNGQKMGKSLGNFINLEELFTGNHPLLTQAYSPMTVRFFILQAHYRSTVDFSNEALQASEKGLARLLEARTKLDNKNFASGETSDTDIQGFFNKASEAMNDDLNTPVVISQLFEAARIINSAVAGQLSLSEENIAGLKRFFDLFLFELLGIKNELKDGNVSYDAFAKAVDILLGIRMQAKQNKDWATSDKIRNELTALGFEIKDTRDGFEWKLN